MRFMLRVLIPITLWLVATAASQAQSPVDCFSDAIWIPVPDNGRDSLATVVAFDNRIYLLYHNSVDQSTHLQRWNGTRWESPLNFKLVFSKTWYSTTVLTVIGGKLSIIGSIDSVDGRDVRGGFIQLNGSTWERVAYPSEVPGTAPVSIVEFRGDLYASGHFTLGGEIYNVVRRRNGVWEGIATMRGTNDRFISPFLFVKKEALYVAGGFETVNGRAMQGIVRWDGTRFWSLGKGVEGIIGAVEELNGDIYVAGLITVDGKDAVLARWDGTSWATFPHRHWGGTRPILKAFKGHIYFRNDIFATHIYRWNREGNDRVSDVEGAVLDFIEFQGSLYAAGDLYSSCGTVLSGLARLCIGDNCGNISGSVFDNKDYDCARDSAEPGLAGYMIRIEPGPYFTTTNKDGRFQAIVPPGEYNVRVMPRRHRIFCSSSQTVLVNDSPGSATVDFATKYPPRVHDVGVSIAGSLARPGRPMSYSIRYNNIGTMDAGGFISLALDSRLRFDSSSIAPSRITGSLIEWDFSGLRMDEFRMIHVHATVPETATLGTLLTSYATAYPLDRDAWVADNQDSSCLVVRAAYDPNDITATPGSPDDSIHDLHPADSALAYRIRFQNTGNDTAFRIVVLDTLNPAHDLSTFTLGASSHPCAVDFPYPHVIRFTFDNILLPDSTVNEPASHGFVKYTVRVKNGLPPGTIFPNRASIYFDFNAPVLTNTVRTRIPEQVLGDDTLVYYLPTRCPGHTEQVVLTFYNITRTDDAISITFNGEQAKYYSLDKTLPFALTPTRTIQIPVTRRWMTPGADTTTMEIRTSSGLFHKVKLVAVTEDAPGSILNLREIHLAPRTGDFDTCFVVWNTYYTRLMLADTAWIAESGNYQLLSPQFPYYLPVGDSVELCLRVTGHNPDSRAVLNIGGSILDSSGMEQCVVQVITIDAKGASLGVDAGRDAQGHLFCSPNPSPGRIRVEFPVYKRGLIRLAIVDMRGAEVALLDNSIHDVGRYTTEYDASHLPNGNYLVRLEQEGGSELQMISIAR